MSQLPKPQEASMEEISASIRRLIADDDASKTAQRTAEPPPPAPPPAAPPRAAAPPPEPKPEAAIETPTLRLPAAAPAAVLEEQPPDLLDLTDAIVVSPPAPAAASPAPAPAQQFRRIEGHSDMDFDEASEKPAVARSGEAMRRQLDEPGDGQLISSATSAAVDSAFNALAYTVLVQNAHTLEDLVREMLRPMLRTWLDDSLPAIVERLVRAEIERVSRGRVG